MLEFIREHLLISAYFSGFVTAIIGFITLYVKWQWSIFSLRKRKRELEDEVQELVQKRYYLLNEINEGLERYRLEKQAEIDRKKAEIERELEEQKRKRYRKFNEELAKLKGEVLREEAMKVAAKQEEVYKDLIRAFEDICKERNELRKQIEKLRKENKTLKGKFSNHIQSVVRQAKYEILVHALRQRPDKKRIVSALKK